MIKKLIPLFAACTLITGCVTSDDPGDAEAVLTDAQIKEALSAAKPPQQFGFAVYPTGTGIAMRGAARLHPLHMATAEYTSDFAPVITITGSASRQKMNALIDPSSAASVVDFSTAREFKSTFLGLDGRYIPYRGDLNIGPAEAYAAVIPQLRIDQLFIENSPVYVRMATGSLGALSRGIQQPKIDALIGYEILKNFEYIRFNINEKELVFSATSPYMPNENLLIGAASIVSAPGVGLAIAGMINGEPSPILLDFAGDYAFAMEKPSDYSTKQVELGEVVFIDTPTLQSATMDGLPRAGLMMLSKYVVTVCPRTGIVYFERPAR